MMNLFSALFRRRCSIRPFALAGALVGLLMVSTSSARALGFEFEARYWSLSFDGRVRLVDPTLDLGVDLGQDLGLDSDDALEGRLTFRPGLGLFVRAGFLTLSAAGGRSIGVSLEELPIAIDAEVSGDLDFDYGRLALGWQFVAPGKTLRIGPYVEAKGLRGDASLRARAPFIDESVSEDFEAAFGSVGALFELQPTDRVQLFLDVSVLVGEDEADWNEGEVGLRYFPIDPLGIGVGYRQVEIGGEVDDVRLDLDFDGFFVTLLLRI